MATFPHRVFSPLLEQELSVGGSVYTVTRQFSLHHNKEEWQAVLLWLREQTSDYEYFLVTTQNLKTDNLEIAGYKPSMHWAIKVEEGFRHSGFVYTPSAVLAGDNTEVQLYYCHNKNGQSLLVVLEKGKCKAFEWGSRYSPTTVQ